MAPFEPNEVLAFAFVLLALIVTAVVRAHPANTGRTRSWWGRFLALLVLLLIAELATNVEQAWPDDSSARATMNLIEHLALLVAGGWALVIAIRALVETHKRMSNHEEAGEHGSDHSGD